MFSNVRLANVARFLAAVVVFALAASCVESEDLTDSTMDGFVSFGSDELTVSSSSTGVELVGLGVELDPHFLSLYGWRLNQ